MEPQKYSVFISHSSQNAERANDLCRVIEERGLRCWIAPRDIIAGCEYASEIVRGIEASATTMILVSSESNKSKHVLREVEQAVKLGKPIFPVLLENVKLDRTLDYYISAIHWLDAISGNYDRVADALAVAISGDEAWKDEAIPPSMMRKLRYRPDWLRVVIVSALVAMIIACSIGYASYSYWKKTQSNFIDNNYLSLGYVTFSPDPLAKGLPGDKTRIIASIYPYNTAAKYSDIKLVLRGLSVDGNPDGNVSSLFDGDVVGKPESIFLMCRILGV